VAPPVELAWAGDARYYPKPGETLTTPTALTSAAEDLMVNLETASGRGPGDHDVAVQRRHPRTHCRLSIVLASLTEILANRAVDLAQCRGRL
jgi:hypothetical protein